ncbi:hypothetical protein COLO4_16093 [Corchorus olitorius]|uniref:Uncharacterized protein n=1 Tax=Corchorus olitorius TaxID=93759 RepID=A0A1R3JJN9_9ROSI|nr:hypothetical protein COLO4_16093 [Corchorus olitorius]
MPLLVCLSLFCLSLVSLFVWQRVADVAKWDDLEACLGQPKVNNPT